MCKKIYYNQTYQNYQYMQIIESKSHRVGFNALLVEDSFHWMKVPPLVEQNLQFQP